MKNLKFFEIHQSKLIYMVYQKSESYQKLFVFKMLLCYLTHTILIMYNKGYEFCDSCLVIKYTDQIT